ncbi:hypothetical protein PM082_009733 [Marasmius tenuissimus]|nr:hypothetical protein PM082_009733 [Marasmius tenuissimus]
MNSNPVWTVAKGEKDGTTWEDEIYVKSIKKGRVRRGDMSRSKSASNTSESTLTIFKSAPNTPEFTSNISNAA